MEYQEMLFAARKIADSNLSKAVEKALFLIAKRDFSIKGAIKCCAKEYPVKAHIEREIKNIFPAGYFQERAKQAFRDTLFKDEKQTMTGAAIRERQLVQQRKRHMADIKEEAA